MATDKQTEKRKVVHVVRSLSDTADLAAALLPELIQSQVISLEGPLGAGKTHFVKAIATALGITTEITSPTFTLLQSYGDEGLQLHHSDWYRLDSSAEAFALGLGEYYGEGLMIIEWGDKFPELLPPGTLRIRIEPQADESRIVTFNY